MDYDNKKYLKLIYLVFSLFLLSFSAAGQNVKVILDGPTDIRIDDRFRLNVTVNAEPTEFNPPDLKDFNILSGPDKFTGTNIEVDNGRMKQSVEFTYSYILQPRKAGKFNLGTASYTVNGKKYTSNSLTIEVTGTGSSAQNNQSQVQQEQNIDETDEIFLRVILDKTNVHQGEFITGTAKIYTKYKIQIDPLTLPAIDGFYTQEIETPLAPLKLEVINRQQYGTTIVKKFVLIPQKTGELTIPSYKVICTLNSFFPQSYEIKSRPVKVTVKPLPTRPASFTGAVGKFNFDVKYDKTKVKENEPVILKISVNGAGNIKLFDAPKISFPEGIDTSEPSVTNKTNDKDGGISGSKLFEYLLIPRAPGKITLPPVEFSYFDPIAKQYKTLTTGAVTLEVEPGTGGSKIASGSSREDLKFLGKDIEYIKLNDIKLRKSGSRLYGSVLFYIGYLLPLILFITILVLRRNYIRQNANTALTRNRKAQKYAIKRLKMAKEYLAQSKKENFYEEVLKALWGYLSDKLNIPVSELSRETASDQLLQSSVDEDSINRVMNLLDTCEYARYAPASADNSMEADYREAIAIITQIQERIR